MTRDEKDHLERLAELGCIVCLERYSCWSPAEIHHLRSGQGLGQRASNYHAIGLCPAHHRLGGYGVAIHSGQKEWEKRFGTELELLAAVRSRLGIEVAA